MPLLKACTLTAALVMFSVVPPSPPASASASGPGADFTITTTQDHDTRAWHSTLMLMLSNPQGPLPFNLLIGAVHGDPLKRQSPHGPTLEFSMSPNFAGPFDSKPPQVVFVLDDGGPKNTIAFGTGGDQPLCCGAISGVTMSFDAGTIERLVRARVIKGKLLGLPFVGTKTQIAALSEFNTRIQKPGK